MKKLFIFICMLTTYTAAHATYYNSELQAVYEEASQTCQSAENDTKLPNPVDGATYFLCIDGEAWLLTCPLLAGHSNDEEMLPYYAINATEMYCDIPKTQEDMENNFTARCYEDSPCDCRDNPHDYAKTTGTCECAYSSTYGFGLMLDYTTCCAPMQDITDTNRAAFDSGASRCYVSTGYTFADKSGKFKFTSNCYEN